MSANERDELVRLRRENRVLRMARDLLSRTTSRDIINSSRYEILLALNFLKHNAYPHLAKFCPYMTLEREPGSLYLRIRR